MTRRTGPSDGIFSIAWIAWRVGVLASTPPSTANRERLLPGSPQSRTTWCMSGRRASGRPTGPSACTGTKLGSKATGKLEELRAASASSAAVATTRGPLNGSCVLEPLVGRFHRKWALWIACGSRCPSASTDTIWVGLSSVVIIVRSIGASAADRSRAATRGGPSRR